MNTTPRTETTALIAAMEHWAKTVSKNGGIAAITIQEGADRLRELETELAAAKAEIENLIWNLAGCSTIAQSGKPTDYSHELARPALHDVNRLAARAEKAEAECLEQARLLGMSGSREASLLSKISQLERQLEKNNS
jgi:hypothetical protein